MRCQPLVLPSLARNGPRAKAVVLATSNHTIIQHRADFAFIHTFRQQSEALVIVLQTILQELRLHQLDAKHVGSTSTRGTNGPWHLCGKDKPYSATTAGLFVVVRPVPGV